MRLGLEKLLYRLWGGLPIPNWLRWIILWAGNQKFLIGVAAVVLDENENVLFFKHTYRPEMPWGLPGGWLKKNENPARAVEREICEESGLVVEVLHPLWVTERNHVAGLDIIYLGRPVSGVFRPSVEVSEARYFALKDFPVVYPDTEEIIGMAIERTRKAKYP
ncbi:MAG: NUDIX domain-containing protein [Anaerolineaceae bacterium]|nr:NUDIX domain-containing protein [Anaerolineaceae bacterium]